MSMAGIADINIFLELLLCLLINDFSTFARWRYKLIHDNEVNTLPNIKQVVCRVNIEFKYMKRLCLARRVV